MPRKILIKTAVMAAALALVPSIANAEDQPPAAAGQSQGQSAAPTGADADSASRSGSHAGRVGMGAFNEQKFVMKAMEGNQFEIQLAQLAQQKAESAEVKQLAQTILQDHQQANQMLTQAASGGAGGQSPQPGQSARPDTGSSGSPPLGPVCQAKLAEFQKLQGAEFDQAYVYGQLADHIMTVLKYRDASTQAQSPQIKQYATQTLPKLQSHLQHIQRLAGWDEASQASSTLHGSDSSSDGSHRSGNDAKGAASDKTGAGASRDGSSNRSR